MVHEVDQYQIKIPARSAIVIRGEGNIRKVFTTVDRTPRKSAGHFLSCTLFPFLFNMK